MDFDLNGKPPEKDIVGQLEAVELMKAEIAYRVAHAKLAGLLGQP